MSIIMKELETEPGYARQCTTDGSGEYSYIFTQCKNMWYSVRTNPMSRDGCLCPKCGKIVKVVIPDDSGK